MDKVEGFFQPGSFLELNSSLLLLFLLSRSVVSDSLRPHGLQHARFPCPSPFARVCSKSRPLSQWCHPTISSSVVRFSSHPQSSPTSGSFPVSQLFASGGQRSVSFHNSPSSEYSGPIYLHSDKILSRRIQSWVWRKPYYIGEHALPISLDELRGWIKKPKRTDTLTHSWSGKGLRVAHATPEFQSPLIYLVECGNKIRETTMAGGTVWLLNAEGVIILSVCVSSYQKLTLRVGWGWDLHFLFIFYWDLLFFTEITSTLNCGTWFWDTPSLLHLYLLFPTTKAWEEVWSLGHRLKS